MRRIGAREKDYDRISELSTCSADDSIRRWLPLNDQSSDRVQGNNCRTNKILHHNYAHQWPERSIASAWRCATSDLPSCLLTRSAIKPPIHPVLPPKIRTFVMGVGSVEEDMVEHVVEEKMEGVIAVRAGDAMLMWQNRMVVKKKAMVVKKKVPEKKTIQCMM